MWRHIKMDVYSTGNRASNIFGGKITDTRPTRKSEILVLISRAWVITKKSDRICVIHPCTVLGSDRIQVLDTDPHNKRPWAGYHWIPGQADFPGAESRQQRARAEWKDSIGGSRSRHRREEIPRTVHTIKTAHRLVQAALEKSRSVQHSGVEISEHSNRVEISNSRRFEMEVAEFRSLLRSKSPKFEAFRDRNLSKFFPWYRNHWRSVHSKNKRGMWRCLSSRTFVPFQVGNHGIRQIPWKPQTVWIEVLILQLRKFEAFQDQNSR